MPTVIQAQAGLTNHMPRHTVQTRIYHRHLAIIMAFSFVFLWGTQNLSMASSTYPDALLVAENTAEAKPDLKELQKKAEQGNADAQGTLGAMYYYGEGVKKDYKKALYYFEQAAKQDNVDAQYFLGGMYRQGQGVEQDYTKAIQYYELAAKQGDADAQNNLGAMYYNDHGIQQDYTKTISYFELAAKQGNANAQYNLGVMYDQGHGVP